MCPKFKPKPGYTKKKSGHLSKTTPKVCPFIMNEAPTYNVSMFKILLIRKVGFVSLFVLFCHVEISQTMRPIAMVLVLLESP
jgi:hypothetical protein